MWLLVRTELYLYFNDSVFHIILYHLMYYNFQHWMAFCPICFNSAKTLAILLDLILTLQCSIWLPDYFATFWLVKYALIFSLSFESRSPAFLLFMSVDYFSISLSWELWLHSQCQTHHHHNHSLPYHSSHKSTCFTPMKHLHHPWMSGDDSLLSFKMFKSVFFICYCTNLDY